jgi:hypothetical protein
LLFHPTILALYAGSLLVSFMVLYAAPAAVQILRRWDLRSGSELQLTIERKTYLISTLLAYACGFELLSLFLYIFSAEQLHPFFVGAMCAAGSLYANPYGYPTLIVKLVNFLVAGIWLIVNYVDHRGEDYPLIKQKYVFFLLLVPLILLETVLQANYFLRLNPDIITSCCGSLFSSANNVLPSGPNFLPRFPAKTVFYAVMGLTIGSGGYSFVKSRGVALFSGLSALACAVSILSIFSFISQYIYELPTHACPFCLLQREYHYIGYPLYLTLLGGTTTGIGAGILNPCRKIDSLSSVIPALQKKLVLAAVILFLFFTAIVALEVHFSNLIME